MYESFYRLSEKPFQIVPDARYLFRSGKHENALTYLEYGLSEQVGMILLTGEVGSGKTTLIQYLLERLPDSTAAAVVFNSTLSPEDLLRMVLSQFELEPQADKAANLNTLNHFLISLYGQRRHALLVVDEAQNLPAESLEEVRMLSNLQSETATLLQVVLVGQPELRERLARPEFRQVAQRIAVSYHLTGLTREDTGRYIAHRLQVVGGSPDLFTEAAVDLIHQISRGIPRAINVACQAALVYGFAEEAPRISQDIVKQIIDDNLTIGLNALEEPEKNVSAPPKDPLGGRIATLEALVKELKDTIEARCNGPEVKELARLLEEERAINEKLKTRQAELEQQLLVGGRRGPKARKRARRR